jgi:hypothetical protein
VRLSGLFDEPDHLLDRRDRIALQSKRESEVEHQLGVARALDRSEQRVVDRVQELSGDPGGELAEFAVVPGRMGAAVEPRLSALVVPADAEAVAVPRRRTCRACRLWSMSDRSRLTSNSSSRIGEPE